jgi:hypothetical protein
MYTVFALSDPALTDNVICKTGEFLGSVAMLPYASVSSIFTDAVPLIGKYLDGDVTIFNAAGAPAVTGGTGALSFESALDGFPVTG